MNKQQANELKRRALEVSEELAGRLRGYTLKKIKECKGCGGSGVAEQGRSDGATPCPTCAPFWQLGDYLLWHEPVHFTDGALKGQIKDCSCGQFGKLTRLGRSHTNPNFSIPSLHAVLVELELWEAFVFWHEKQCTIWNHLMQGGFTHCIAQLVRADILQSETLFPEVVNAFIGRDETNVHN